MSRTLTIQDWTAEGVRRFGEDRKTWRFRCPSCGHIASVQDWIDAVGAEHANRFAAFSCVGRWLPNAHEAFGGKGPCNYAGGGLFGLNPVHVVFDTHAADYFEFATEKARGSSEEEQMLERECSATIQSEQGQR